jgi:tetratricopeptide (TPR) repeat protein
VAIGQGSTTTADSLSQVGQYALAATYYEKAIFEQSNIGNNVQIINELLFKKTQLLKAQKTFDEAWQTTQRFDLTDLSDSLQFRYRYESALCAYLSQRYAEAHNQLQQTRFYVRDTLLTEGLDVLEILTLNELERWTESKEIFSRYVSRNRLTINVEELYAFLKKKPKNPDKAQLLSFLMPGLGQAYAGYWKQGLVSAGLQALALGFGVYHVLNRYYLIGFFTGAGLFQAFYFGGTRRAVLMAEETNRKRKARYNQQLRATLINAEQQKRK